MTNPPTHPSTSLIPYLTKVHFFFSFLFLFSFPALFSHKKLRLNTETYPSSLGCELDELMNTFKATVDIVNRGWLDGQGWLASMIYDGWMDVLMTELKESRVRSQE